MSSSPPPFQPPNPVPVAAEVSRYNLHDHMGIVKYIRALEIAEGKPDPPPPPPSMVDERKPKPLLPPPPPLCARVGCGELGSQDKRCGKCLVACYFSIECKREDRRAHKKQCKLNRKFQLREQTEEARAREE